MNMSRVGKRLALLAFTCLGLGAALPAAADPVWDRIKSSGQLVCGAIPNDPVGSWFDRTSNQWEGYEVELCRAIAIDLSKEMGRTVTPEFRETSWKTIVLDLHANKIDIWPGMSATPERQKALSMVGPMYGLSFCGLTNKNFETDGTWDSLNKPAVRIATVTGTSVEAAFKKFAPNATHITLTEYPELTLAVQSGRADVLGSDALRCLTVMKDAPKAFGKLVFPSPMQSMGSSAGVHKSAEQLTTWLTTWSQEQRSSGRIKPLFMRALDKAGLDTSAIPPEVQF